MSFSYLEIKPQVSKCLFALLVILYFMALMVLSVIHINWLARALLVAFVIIGGYKLCWRKVLLHELTSVLEIVFHQGEWRIVNKAGEQRTVELLGETYFSRWLIILHFRAIEQGKRTVIVLPRDSVDYHSFRRLRVVLRYCCF